ncbi:DNA polymerase IV [soil metagenome]
MSRDRADDRADDWADDWADDRADDWGCPILHVDMDAFYASVTVRERPDLQGRAVIVGGGHRGVVLSASYAARVHGVRSAMPVMRARRLCPHAVVIAPDFALFSAVSAAVMETFRTITPLVEAMSLDEAFLDVSGAGRRLGSPATIGAALREQIAAEQQINCSVGVAATTDLAKLASRRAKPDGLLVVSRDRATAFLHPLDVGELWGVGEVTAEQLHRLGLRTVGDLAHTPLVLLRRALGAATADHLHTLSWGGGRTFVTMRRSPDEPDRSMGADETFSRDTDDPEVVRRELLRLSVKLASRLRAGAVIGRTVTIRVRFSDFTTITRSRTLRDPTDVAVEIYAAAAQLFAALGLQRARLRLVGVRVEGLRSAPESCRQRELGAREHGWAEAERAVDKAAARFGSRAISPAALIGVSRP